MTAPSFIQPATPETDKVERLKALATQARDLQLEIEELEASLKQSKAELNRLYSDEMPQLMMATGLDHIGIAADGNKPGVDFRLRNFYAANIAAGWSDDKKSKAFSILDKYDASDLIKTEVKAALPKGQLELAQQLMHKAEELGISAQLTKAVHTQTLTAWLRELVEKHGTIPPKEDLDALGAAIGKIVRPQDRKDAQ